MEDEVKLMLEKSDSSSSGGRARLSFLLAALRAHQHCKFSLLIVCLGPGSKFQRSGFLSLARSRDRIPFRCFTAEFSSSASRLDGASSTLAVEGDWARTGLCNASEVRAEMELRSNSKLRLESALRLSDASAGRGISKPKLKPWSEEDGEIGVSHIGVVAPGGAES
jgi:hypothetical protein